MLHKILMTYIHFKTFEGYLRELKRASADKPNAKTLVGQRKKTKKRGVKNQCCININPFGENMEYFLQERKKKKKLEHLTTMNIKLNN